MIIEPWTYEAVIAFLETHEGILSFEKVREGKATGQMKLTIRVRIGDDWIEKAAVISTPEQREEIGSTPIIRRNLSFVMNRLKGDHPELFL